MKKEILEALKAKFPGVSDNVLDRIANKLAKTVTTAEQVKTAVEGVTIQQVIESYGDSRATEASNTARENAVLDYESRYAATPRRDRQAARTSSSSTRVIATGRVTTIQYTEVRTRASTTLSSRRSSSKR